MPEAGLKAHRPLEDFEAGDHRVRLRTKEIDQAFVVTLAATAGADHFPSVGRVVEREGWQIIATGARRWLFVATAAPLCSIEELMQSDEIDNGASITDQSDGLVGLVLEGPLAPDVLARLVSLDLDALADDHAATTVMEHLTITLVRQDAQRFDILGARSTADSLAHAVAVAVETVARVDDLNTGRR